MGGCKRILLALPEGLQENLVVFPVVRSLVRSRPDTSFLFLADQSLTSFLAALYGQDQIAGIRREELFWGEPHFLELRRVTEAFRPDVSINLRAGSPPLLHFSIRAAQANRQAGGPTSTPSSAGLIWPVNGPITSPFGWRWGRMHEGIDIGVGYGTPIHAAASGRVIYAGWMSGYGNLVAIDHGRGISTASGHQSQITVSVGQIV